TPMPPRMCVWALGALQWIWFVYIGSRARTGVFMLTMIAAYYLPRRRNPAVWRILITVLLLSFLVGFQAEFRGQFTDLSFNFKELSWEKVKAKVLPASMGGTKGSRGTLGDLEITCTTAVISLVPETVGYNYGYTLLEVPTHAIPRYFWPDKIYPQM